VALAESMAAAAASSTDADAGTPEMTAPDSSDSDETSSLS
jgi:hypothetical protein